MVDILQSSIICTILFALLCNTSRSRYENNRANCIYIGGKINTQREEMQKKCKKITNALNVIIIYDSRPLSLQTTSRMYKSRAKCWLRRIFILIHLRNLRNLIAKVNYANC